MGRAVYTFLVRENAVDTKVPEHSEKRLDTVHLFMPFSTGDESLCYAREYHSNNGANPFPAINN